jgi:hypothetical protein
MIIEEIIADRFSEKNAEKRSRQANFRTLGYKFFEAGNYNTNIPINIIKENLQFDKFCLPHPYDENLIKYDFAPVYWVKSSPLMLALEKYLKTSEAREFGINYFNYVKEFYFKWVIIDSPADKKYFALSAFNALQGTAGSDCVLNSILQATLLIFEKSLFDENVAENKLNAALNLAEVVDIEDRFKKELKYVINIYFGFLYLKQNNTEKAITSFERANILKPGGINSSFYLALIYARLNKQETAQKYIQKIFEIDQSRISFAIAESNPEMFDHFVHKPLASYFFEFREFANLISVFYSQKEKSENIARIEQNRLRVRISKFRDIRIDDYLNKKILDSIQFLDKTFRFYCGTENILVLGASKIFAQKFEELIESVRFAISERVKEDISEKLEIYDRFIEDSKGESVRLRNEFNQLKEKIKEKHINKCDRVAKIITSNISDMELEIKNLDSVEKYNHKTAFNNAITYSLIMALIIFLIAGLAGFANNSEINAWDFKSVMSVVFSVGLKWAAVSMFIGTLIAFIISASTLMEKSNRKLQLMREIARFKSSKDQEIANLKQIEEEQESLIEERYEKRIKEYKDRMEGLQRQRMTEETKLNQSAMKKYLKLDEQLAELLA